jgi:hypothetical protein
MSTKLKPCPCCDSDAIMRVTSDNIFSGQSYIGRYTEPVASQNNGYRVRCHACGLQTCWWHLPGEAKRAWDKRVNES